MKIKFLIIIVSLLFISINLRAIDMQGKIYNEMSGQKKDINSYFNPNNLHEISNFQYYLRGNLIFKNKFSEFANGVINVEMQYYPSHYNILNPLSSDPTKDQDKKERFFIKEMYIDILTNIFTIRVGKQFVKWGSGNFFNPLDIVNIKRDPLRNKDEAEGFPFVYLTVPIKTFLSFEVLAQAKNNENKMDLKEIPVITKIAVSLGSFSFFTFGRFKQDEKPIFGINMELVLGVSSNSNLSIYCESLLKLESQRYKINIIPEPLEKKKYPAFVFGTRYQANFTETKVLDGLVFIVEYYYDHENWNKNEFKNYLAYIDSLKSDRVQHLTAIGFFETYKNSRHYLFASLYFNSIFITDFYIGNSFVISLEDGSCFLMTHIYYTFSNTNAEVGLKSVVYFGGRETEFGNSISKFNITLYAQLAF